MKYFAGVSFITVLTLKEQKTLNAFTSCHNNECLF